MKRYFFVFHNEAVSKMEIATINAEKYEDALKQLSENGVNPLFLSAYTTPLSRFVCKYLKTVVDLNNEQLCAAETEKKDWKITQPYLYYNTRRYEFAVSDTMKFDDYSLQLIGYCSSQAMQNLLVKQDF